MESTRLSVKIRSLAGFHAFTGCDTTSAFFRKGKKGPMKILEKNSEFVQYFKNNDTPNEIAASINPAERFVCHMYNLRSCKSVNEGRYRKFELAYNPRKAKKSLIKSFSAFDSSCIPPCQTVLEMHIKRCIFQAYIWLHADEDNPSI